MAKNPNVGEKTTPSHVAGIDNLISNLLRRDGQREHTSPWFGSNSRRTSEGPDSVIEYPTRRGSSDVD